MNFYDRLVLELSWISKSKHKTEIKSENEKFLHVLDNFFFSSEFNTPAARKTELTERAD